MGLRDALRDDQTFSAYLTNNLSVPVLLVQNLLNARVTLAPVSMALAMRASLC